MNEEYYLGIDPSTSCTGWGVLNSKGELIEYGDIPVDKDDLNVVSQLMHQHEQITHIVDKYQIKGIACEDQFLGKNANTLIKLSRVTGCVMLIAGQKNIPFKLFYPSSWRKVTLNNGKATKKDCIQWCLDTYDVKFKVKENDIAEGIGVAYAGLQYFKEN